MRTIVEEKENYSRAIRFRLGESIFIRTALRGLFGFICVQNMLMRLPFLYSARTRGVRESALRLTFIV